jgi:hypothetical protein
MAPPKALLAFAFAAIAWPSMAQATSLADLAFLEGEWTSDRSGFVIEECWSNASAGVVLGMSRGVQAGAVRFLRFAVVEQAGDRVTMRFKRYNPDYSTWEEDGPTVMHLVGTGRVRGRGSVLGRATDRISRDARADGGSDRQPR